ncbi:MAG: GIY-YIG nuclease family protein, partial [Verrucomicrobiales bacterium]
HPRFEPKVCTEERSDDKAKRQSLPFRHSTRSFRLACSWQATFVSVLCMALLEGINRVECPEPVEGLCWVYILWCGNDTLYVGQTQNIAERLKRHVAGTGARHTKQVKGLILVFVEGPMIPEVAIERERQLKKWSRKKKLALIRGDFDELRKLSRSRNKS